MLVLASQSPRRLEILQRAGIPVCVRVSGIPELRLPSESPENYAQRLAREKAEAVSREAGEVVLGADTIVVLDGVVLEKPADAAHAVEMLTLLSGKEHRVVTGICLLHDGGVISDYAETTVHFVPLSASEIDEYAASGEPLDKAGAYAIQGLASRFIDRIDGCYFNVMGLPVSLVYGYWKAITGKNWARRCIRS